MGTKPAMRCHYEVLKLERSCVDDEIKKSYRKLALKYHPDKNPDNIEDCTREFHLIQQAYDVLIDPQERAWYDKHREAILRGGLGHGDKYEDNCVDVYQYFNTSCYAGYGDDEKGFYAIFKQVFEDIAAEDKEFVDDPENLEVPSFGDSSSSYDEVVGPFYGHWESYCTSRSYVWAEKYDTREAPNRQIRRLMEQDNKKLREKAKKERNEEVRALIGFVRKRDRRVQAYKKKLEERAAEVKRLAAENQKRQREERLRDMAQYEDTGWSANTELEKDLAALEAHVAGQFGDPELYAGDGEEEEELEEEPIDDFYCIACNKSFRTDKAFANHEKSKKHRENVSVLRAQMEEEEGVLHEDDDLDLSNDLDPDTVLTDKTELPSPNTSKSKLSKKQKKKKKQRHQMEEEDDETIEAELAKLRMEVLGDQEIEYKENGSVVENEVVTAAEPTEQGATPEPVSEPQLEAECLDAATQQPGPEDGSIERSSAPDDPAENPDDSQKTKKSLNKGTSHKCHVCHQGFPTRNKLFGHINYTGHALRVDGPPSEVEEGKRGKKGKKKGKR